MIYLAHLSDVHITAPRLEWRLRDWFTKRWPGWVNFRWLGRRFRFRMADEVLRLLVAEVRRRLARREPGLRILVTHYPVSLSSGRRERRTHGLRDLEEVVRVAERGGVVLWVHGHRHTPYHLTPPPLSPFPVVCAGSATQ